MKPIIHLFTPIFFVAIGLSLNLKAVAWHSPAIWSVTALLFVSAVVGKLAAGFLVVREPVRTRLIVGTAMIPRGEVGLIFANIGLSVGALADDLYAAVVLVIALTTLCAPFALRAICARRAPLVQ